MHLANFDNVPLRSFYEEQIIIVGAILIELRQKTVVKKV